VLDDVWEKMPAAEEPSQAFAEGAACGPDGCA
jgi:hypothetical protein